MKGITHFVTGVAAASCFPFAVEAGVRGNPLYFILGGCCGLLPDTLDFKFSRFFCRRDIEVAPDPLRRDAGMIADTVALAVNRAADTGKPVRLKLNTIRLGADLWQRYTVRFDVPKKQVEAVYGPVVDTGRRPVSGGSPRRGKRAEAVAELYHDVDLDYLAATEVDIFDGPFFEMRPRPGGRVRVAFLPWHRAWSHSLVIGLLIGLLAAAVWGVGAGVVAFCAQAAHVAVDQLGFMGCNLFFPFTRERRPGWQLAHSGQALANFALVWGACLLIFWNLARAAPEPIPRMNPFQLAVYGFALPLLLYRLVRSWMTPPPRSRRRKEAERPPVAADVRRRTPPYRQT